MRDSTVKFLKNNNKINKHPKNPDHRQLYRQCCCKAYTTWATCGADLPSLYEKDISEPGERIEYGIWALGQQWRQGFTHIYHWSGVTKG